MNYFFNLPNNIKNKIYSYDSTYYNIYELVMLEFSFKFNQLDELNYILRNFQRRNICFNYYIKHEMQLRGLLND